MLLGILGASLSGSEINRANKVRGTNRAGEGLVRIGYRNKNNKMDL